MEWASLFLALGIGTNDVDLSAFEVFDDWIVPRASSSPSPEDPSIQGAIKKSLLPWTDGVLPIDFSNQVSNPERNLFFEACREWEAVAPVHCVEGSYQGKSLRVMKRFSGCFSLWGMGNHFVFLHRLMNLSDGCWSKQTLLHELGHAFGLIHEHQRPDRDRYLRIERKNVEKGFLWLNAKVNFDHQAAELVTPYDFDSIMHYDRRAFSKNGQDTLIPQPGFEKHADTMGQAQGISPLDAYTLKQLYQ